MGLFYSRYAARICRLGIAIFAGLIFVFSLEIQLWAWTEPSPFFAATATGVAKTAGHESSLLFYRGNLRPGEFLKSRFRENRKTRNLFFRDLASLEKEWQHSLDISKST